MNIHSFPSITVLKERTFHARFCHHCAVCSRPIQRAERHNYYVITDNDAPQGQKLRTIRTHLTCPKECR